MDDQVKGGFGQMEFADKFLLIINILSLIATVLFAIFGVYEIIMGPADAEKMLKKLHIPLNYNRTLIIGFVCVVLLIVSFILRAKLSGKI